MKSIIFGAVLLSCLSNLQAANIHDLDLGEGVYLQGIVSDELVRVVRIDIGRNLVKVLRSEDGTAKWVNPSQLISRESSIVNDVGRTAAVITIAACLLNPEACKNTGSRNSQSNSIQSSGSSAGYKFKVLNNCKHSIMLALRYLKTDGKWSTIGWWTLDGEKHTYLKQDGGYITTNSSVFFYYAGTSDGSLYWGGDNNYTVNGETYAMRRIEDKSGDSEITLSCTD